MLKLIKSITKAEWRFWAKVLLALLIITSISRIFTALYTPPGYIWTGVNYFAPSDRFVYLSYIEQIKDGAFLLDDLYTSPQESAPMLNLFWLGAGLFAKFFHLSAQVTLEILRILLIPLLLLVLYLFLSFFIKNLFQKKLAFLLAVFGGGLGAWLYPILGPFFINIGSIIDYMPIDFVFAESFVFTSAYYSAHYIFSFILFLLIILFIFLAMENKKYIYAVFAGICGLILANFHPFVFAPASFTLSTYLIYLFFKNKKQFFILFKKMFIFSIISLPSIIYHISKLNTPWWQNQTWSSNTEIPNLLFIIIGYGLLLFFAVMQIFLTVKNKKEYPYADFLIIWFFAHITLIFLPVSVQRRFLEGYQIVLVILSSYFITELISKKPWIIKSKIFPATLFVLAFSLSFCIIIYIDTTNALKRLPLLYITQTNYKTIQYLRGITDKNDIIFSDVYNSNKIPGMIARRIYAGHEVETINFEYKLYQLAKFGLSKQYKESERYRFLIDNDIKYFLYDTTWNWGFDPDKDRFLKKIYENNGYKVYKIEL